MLFKNISGHSRPISFLKRAFDENRVTHAYIFYGAGGIGKKTVALNFAKALNCAGNTADKPCDRCISCGKIDNSNHPDVSVIGPEKNGTAIGIERIRELTGSIGLKPFEGKKKVYIIDNADLMTHQAQNALLKTLEEPPQGSVLVLVTENINQLLPTIRSRSQILRFFPSGLDEVKDALKRQYKMPDTEAHILSRLSSGRIGWALNYKEGKFLEARERIIEGLESGTFFDSDFNGLSKKEMKFTLDVLLTWYRDILIAKIDRASQPALINIDKKDVIDDEAKNLGFGYLDEAIRQVILSDSYLEQNVNPKLAMSILGLAITENICTK